MTVIFLIKPLSLSLSTRRIFIKSFSFLIYRVISFYFFYISGCYLTLCVL